MIDLLNRPTEAGRLRVLDISPSIKLLNRELDKTVVKMIQVRGE